MPRPPILDTSSAVEVTEPGRVLSPFWNVFPVTYTVQPSSPRPRATPFPIPRLAPVTRATFPFNLADNFNSTLSLRELKSDQILDQCLPVRTRTRITTTIMIAVIPTIRMILSSIGNAIPDQLQAGWRAVQINNWGGWTLIDLFWGGVAWTRHAFRAR